MTTLGKPGGAPDAVPDERALVERIRRDYAPPPMDGIRAALFDRALEARRTRPRRAVFAWPAVAAVAAATALALWIHAPESEHRAPGALSEVDWVAALTQSPADLVGIDPTAEDPTAGAWTIDSLEGELFAWADPAAEDDWLFGAPDDAYLPDDYQTLALIFADDPETEP